MWWKIKQLYADQNMLALRSPVSKRMFLSDFSFANILHKSCAFCSRLKTPTLPLPWKVYSSINQISIQRFSENIRYVNSALLNFQFKIVRGKTKLRKTT